MAKIIKVVGAGPGNPEYLTVKAKTAIEQAEILVAGKRFLTQFASPGQKTIPIDRNLEVLIQKIKEVYEEKAVTVVAAGDPGFYGILTTLKRYFSREELEVIPGISSVQLAFARIKEYWQDAELVSLHGRDWSELDAVIDAKKIAILTDAEHHPPAIASYLYRRGFKAARVFLCSNLSYSNEVVEEYSLDKLREVENKEPAVVVVIRD